MLCSCNTNNFEGRTEKEVMHESIVIEEEQVAMPGPSRSSTAVTDGRCCSALAVRKVKEDTILYLNVKLFFAILTAIINNETTFFFILDWLTVSDPTKAISLCAGSSLRIHET